MAALLKSLRRREVSSAPITAFKTLLLPRSSSFAQPKHHPSLLNRLPTRLLSQYTTKSNSGSDDGATNPPEKTLHASELMLLLEDKIGDRTPPTLDGELFKLAMWLLKMRFGEPVADFVVWLGTKALIPYNAKYLIRVGTAVLVKRFGTEIVLNGGAYVYPMLHNVIYVYTLDSCSIPLEVKSQTLDKCRITCSGLVKIKVHDAKVLSAQKDDVDILALVKRLIKIETFKLTSQRIDRLQDNLLAALESDQYLKDFGIIILYEIQKLTMDKTKSHEEPAHHLGADAMRPLLGGDFDHEAGKSGLEWLLKVESFDMKSGIVCMNSEKDAQDAQEALETITFSRNGRRLHFRWKHGRSCSRRLQEPAGKEVGSDHGSSLSGSPQREEGEKIPSPDGSIPANGDGESPPP